MTHSACEVFDDLTADRFLVLLKLIEAGQPLTTSRIAERADLPYMTTFRHLASLEDAGLIEANIKQRNARHGKRVLYSPTAKVPTILDRPQQALNEAIAKGNSTP